MLLDFTIQDIETLIPARSILHLISDFTPTREPVWEQGLFKFLLRSQNFPKVLRQMRAAQEISITSLVN